MNKERLLVLAEFLEQLPPEKFDYGIWWSACGTKGCALGWATHIPEFGLQLLDGRTVGLSTDTSDDYLYIGRNTIALRAAMKVFDLAKSEVEHLFHPIDEEEYKATPQEVALKIREFCQ